ncbi:hypothetical protein SAMN02745166_04881 [Prosthecobacter debontii]|uniref:Tellurite resistance protein TerB n=1 Tax=Prosthecobacter debontii TaxID=48467 RepID=A0A1T4Z3S9_9BACT|nr:hypothetical protein [Prosthecobacter debontii]SKB08221.1 hypothetical protein SAMN02745166_04881 [Prosthecobacter debontii]
MTQPQREALFDILSLSIYADAHISLVEEDLIQSAFVAKGWKSEYPKSLFIEESFARAREVAESDDMVMDYLTERASSFTSKTAQAEVLGVVKDLLARDGMTPDENEFFNLLIQAMPKAK